MGTYYELKIDIKLKPIEEIGEEIHTLLTHLFNQESTSLSEAPKSIFPDHPFWSEKRFYQIGFGRYSHDGLEVHLRSEYVHPVIKIRCSINYGYREIDSFLDWITPYVDSVPEPGVYYAEGSYEYGLDHREVKFETNPEGKKSFLMLGHYYRATGPLQDSRTEIKEEWVTLPKPQTP